MTLTLSDHDISTLSTLNLTQSNTQTSNTHTSDPVVIIKSLAQFYNQTHDYRSAFRLYKSNPDYATSLEYVSYMIFFNEFNINAVPEYENLILKIIRHKLKPESCTHFSTEKSRQVSTDERYMQYQTLTDTNISLDDMYRHLYKMFVDGTNYSYEKVIEDIKKHERLDVIKIILGKFDVPELRHVYKEIVLTRRKDKFDIIMGILSKDSVNVQYLSEISEYQVENDILMF